MTTYVWLGSNLNNTDAAFRDWGQQISQGLLAVGLVKTADTGQIDWTTAVRPVISPFYAGYEIWRYPDSSIYMKWEFGSDNSLKPQFRVSVSNGSNGAGVLTGVVSAARTGSINSAGTSAERMSFMCLKDGFFGFHGYRTNISGSNDSWAFFAVARTTDANGFTTSLGATVYWSFTSSNTPAPPIVQALNFSTGYVGPENSDGSFCIVPHRISASYVGLDSQAFVHWTAMPRVYPIMPICTVISVEIPTGSTFSVALIGTIPRTYMALDTRQWGAANGTTTYKLAMLWE